MIHSFSCKSFRNIEVDHIGFSRINILIGPNNAGKTNFIKALTFYSNLLKYPEAGGLQTGFYNAVKRGGWNHIRSFSAPDDKPVELSWRMSLGNEIIDYDFGFMPGARVEDSYIVKESMNSVSQRGYDRPYNFFTCHQDMAGQGYLSTAFSIGEPNERLPFSVNNTEVFCRQYKDIILSDERLYNYRDRKKIGRLLDEMEKSFLGIRNYASSRMDTARMREPVDIKVEESHLLPDASNFIAVFNRYKGESLQWRRHFLAKMQELDVEIEDVDLVMKYDKYVFIVELKNGITVDLSDISEGSLKALVLNMLFNLPSGRENSLLAIDEPENNLHPAWQKVIARWVIESESYEQCFVSTHSPDFLDAFTEQFKNGTVSVFVFNGMGGIQSVSYDKIKQDLGDWELGDLYRTNDPALGGWPW